MHNLTPLASGPRVPGSQGSGPCSPCLLGHSRSPPPDGTVKATIPEIDRDPCRGLETVTLITKQLQPHLTGEETEAW